MRSGTSFFDSTIFGKNIQRFWPLWGSYLFLWLLIIPFNLISRDRRYWSTDGLADAAKTVHESLPLGLYIAFVFGLAAAMLVFGYLYNSRAACMTHALPLRREALFWSSYLAGLAFLLGPHLIVAVVTLGVESVRGVVALESMGVWLLVQSAMCLFFYSFAVFCGMFTGNTLALPIFYGILNFLVWYLQETVSSYMAQFLYGMGFGVWDGGGPVLWCTPTFHMSSALRRDTGVAYLNQPEVIAVYAAAGVVLTVLALYVYKRRHIESAGDVVAVRAVRPVFQYGVAVSAGLLGTILMYVFWGISSPDHVPLVASVMVWSAAGYFAATMLLDKTFRVFHKWKGAAGLAALILIFSLALEFDVLGFERRVPRVEDVEDIPYFTIYGFPSNDGGNPYEVDQLSGLGRDPERQARIIALQQAIVSQSDRRREQDGDNSFTVNLDYQLRGGNTLSRRYYSVPVWRADRDTPGTVTYCMEQLLQDRDLMRHVYGLDEQPPMDRIYAELENVIDENSRQNTGIYDLDSRMAAQLWKAVQQDFDEGTIGVRYLFSEEAWDNVYYTQIQFYWTQWNEDSPAETQYVYNHQVSLSLTPNARHTLAVLEESGVMDGYRFDFGAD